MIFGSCGYKKNIGKIENNTVDKSQEMTEFKAEGTADKDRLQAQCTPHATLLIFLQTDLTNPSFVSSCVSTVNWNLSITKFDR